MNVLPYCVAEALRLGILRQAKKGQLKYPIGGAWSPAYVLFILE